ncbi:YbjN domain-containing protein [Sphingomonas sp. MMS12-HWE2-04]|uniref:YbjN domain-containing protein n=1 Tax=Sphingomonas sp. MMS12-HWE2-04 TaxID=3234199 RepID=UPI00385060BC
MRLTFPAAAGFLLCLSVPAAAEDAAPCAANLVCASAPATVVEAMEKAEFEPKLSKDRDGDPMIESNVAPYQFSLFFYGCTEHVKCDSLRFESAFEKAPENTLELANKWNAQKRFLQAFIRPNGEFVVAYDLATIGGLNKNNFADVLAWWNNQLEELATFFEEEIPKTRAKK